MTLLEKYINQLGISKYRFAKDNEIKESSLRKYLKKETSPNLKTFLKMCEYLKKKKVKFNEKEFMNDFLN
jgi:predicted transcriptional regulator